ncbi:MAG: hypothetical protein ACSHX7_12210 [Luteolibacter sp.]
MSLLIKTTYSDFLSRNSLGSFLLVIGLARIALAAITLNFTYQDVLGCCGIGLDDSGGLARRSIVSAVRAYLSTVLDHTGTMDVTWNASSSCLLGQMGNSYFQDRKVCSCITGNHIVIGSERIDFGKNLNSDHIITTGNGEFDRHTVALYEMTHALGVASLVESDGSSTVTGIFCIHDTCLRNASDNSLMDSRSNFADNVPDLTSEDLPTTTVGGGFQIYLPDL